MFEGKYGQSSIVSGTEQALGKLEVTKNLLEEFAIILLNTATFELEMMLHHGIQEHNINCTSCTCWAHSWSSISNVWRSIKALIPGLYIQGGKAWNQGYIIISRAHIIYTHVHIHMYICKHSTYIQSRDHEPSLLVHTNPEPKNKKREGASNKSTESLKRCAV